LYGGVKKITNNIPYVIRNPHRNIANPDLLSGGAVELLYADSGVPPEVDGDGNRYSNERADEPLLKRLR
jgi:hypothetical protein